MTLDKPATLPSSEGIEIIIRYILFIIIGLCTLGGSVSTLVAENLPGRLTPNIIVAQDGTGDYTTIESALNSVPEGNSKLFVIYVKNGRYEEKIAIEQDFVVLIGESRNGVRIVYPEQTWVFRCKNDPDDPWPAVVNITGSDCTLLNLTIYNNYGELHADDPIPDLDCNIENYENRMKPHGHQFALKSFDGATRLVLLNCTIMADGADTFAPADHETGMYYVRDCRFEGYTDYICPRANCYITDSEFYSRGGSVTLWHDGRASKQKKLVINHCTFDGRPGFKLGRYTHDAQMILLNSTFSKNMADQDIYQAKPDVHWGRRIYYYNCSREGGDYSWHQDNLKTAPEFPEPNKMTPKWTFEGKWDPVEFLKQYALQTLYR